MKMEKATMKKTFLYMFVAVVLGIGIMLFPLWTFFRSYNEEGPIVMAQVKFDSIETLPLPVIKPMYASDNWQNYTIARLSTEGIPTYGDEFLPPPQNQLALRSTDESLQMLAIGFVAAATVYLIVRRRVPRQASTYRFPPI